MASVHRSNRLSLGRILKRLKGEQRQGFESSAKPNTKVLSPQGANTGNYRSALPEPILRKVRYPPGGLVVREEKQPLAKFSQSSDRVAMHGEFSHSMCITFYEEPENQTYKVCAFVIAKLN